MPTVARRGQTNVASECKVRQRAKCGRPWVTSAGNRTMPNDNTPLSAGERTYTDHSSPCHAVGSIPRPGLKAQSQICDCTIPWEINMYQGCLNQLLDPENTSTKTDRIFPDFLLALPSAVVRLSPSE